MTDGPDVVASLRRSGGGWSHSRRLVLAGLAGLFAIAAGSCSHDDGLEPRGADHFRVVVISLDGLRPDAIPTDAPTLLRIAREGAATATAETQDPSLTLPSHTSMVTGLTPKHHGYTWNDDTTAHPNPPTLVTVFDILARSGVAGA